MTVDHSAFALIKGVEDAEGRASPVFLLLFKSGGSNFSSARFSDGGGMPIQKRIWSLTEEAFNSLLARLDSDAEAAAEKYEFIKAEIIKLFECRGCASPIDLADETINRVARRISEGQEIPLDSIGSYFYGVARNVMREYLRNPEKDWTSIETLLPSDHPAEDPEKIDTQRLERYSLERRLECLESCVEKLPPETRDLAISYYRGSEKTRIESRRRMALSLGIPLNTLRIRVHRVRERLEKCLLNCLRESTGG